MKSRVFQLLLMYESGPQNMKPSANIFRIHSITKTMLKAKSIKVRVFKRVPSGFISGFSIANYIVETRTHATIIFKNHLLLIALLQNFLKTFSLENRKSAF
jgi:hypothetical protein